MHPPAWAGSPSGSDRPIHTTLILPRDFFNMAARGGREKGPGFGRASGKAVGVRSGSNPARAGSGGPCGRRHTKAIKTGWLRPCLSHPVIACLSVSAGCPRSIGRIHKDTVQFDDFHLVALRVPAMLPDLTSLGIRFPDGDVTCPDRAEALHEGGANRQWAANRPEKAVPLPTRNAGRPRPNQNKHVVLFHRLNPRPKGAKPAGSHQ